MKYFERIRKIEYFALVRNEINWDNNWMLIRNANEIKFK